METSIAEIVSHVEAQNKMEKSESSPTTALKVLLPGYIAGSCMGGENYMQIVM